jgi:hypothetical protein
MVRRMFEENTSCWCELKINYFEYNNNFQLVIDITKILMYFHSNEYF